VDRTLCLLVNPHAGGGRARRALPAVEARLRAAGVPFRTELTRSVDHARALARDADAAGEIVVPFSGDGLVGAVADTLRHGAGGLMGVLPGGRGNDFARVLGIPRDPVAACDVLVGGVARPLDLGLAEGRAFVGIASLGLDSDANRFANRAPARLGRLAYAYGAARAIASWRPATFTVVVDDATTTFTGWSVACANAGAYGGGMLLAPHAALDDGLLDVVCIARMSRLGLLARLPRVFRGAHLGLDAVRLLRGAEVRVAADRPFDVYADGDAIARLPVTLTVAPSAVRVLAPR